MLTPPTEDVRFTVPLYTSAEAARYLDVPASTFATWVKGYRCDFPDRPPVTGELLVTGLTPERPGAASIPFGGLAEGMFLSALRKSGVPLQQIRPALDLVRTRLGVEHALASRRLYVAGARLLWEISADGGVDQEARHGARDLIVLRSGRYVFRQVIEQYLRRITYDDTYASRILLPQYEVAEIAVDPEINFGKPFFTHTGTPLHVVRDLSQAGETVEAIADDFDLPIAQVMEAAQRAGFLPISEAWYRNPGWQAAEAEADADLAEGRTRTFDSMEEMFKEFDAVRG